MFAHKPGARSRETLTRIAKDNPPWAPPVAASPPHGGLSCWTSYSTTQGSACQCFSTRGRCYMAFSDLASDSTRHRFCCVLLVKTSSRDGHMDPAFYGRIARWYHRTCGALAIFGEYNLHRREHSEGGRGPKPQTQETLKLSHLWTSVL